MLTPSELIDFAAMSLWQDISLKLYKDFAEEYLINTMFRYNLKNGQVLEVHFTEEGIVTQDPLICNSKAIYEVNIRILGLYYLRDILKVLTR